MPPHLPSLQREGNELAVRLLLPPGRLSWVPEPPSLTSSPCSSSGASAVTPLPPSKKREGEKHRHLHRDPQLLISSQCCRPWKWLGLRAVSTTLGFCVLCWAGRMPARGGKARQGNAGSFGVKVLSQRSGILFLFLYFSRLLLFLFLGKAKPLRSSLSDVTCTFLINKNEFIPLP